MWSVKAGMRTVFKGDQVLATDLFNNYKLWEGTAMPDSEVIAKVMAQFTKWHPAAWSKPVELKDSAGVIKETVL